MLINYNVQQSQFFDITSDIHGAAISVSRDNCSLTLISDLFVNCSAPVEGGGFYASVERVEASCLFFERCFANDEGAAFHITSRSLHSNIESCMISKSLGFLQDSFISYGKNHNIIEKTNVSHCSCADNMISNWPLGNAMVKIRYSHASSLSLSNNGLIYSQNLLSIEFSNIIDCSSLSFICFYAPALSQLSLSNNVFARNSFGSLRSGNAPSLSFSGNTFDTAQARDLFGDPSGAVIANPDIYKIDKRCGNEANCTRNSTSRFFCVIHLAVQCLCPQEPPSSALRSATSFRAPPAEQ